jgi:hypothetical protein
MTFLFLFSLITAETVKPRMAIIDIGINHVDDI